MPSNDKKNKKRKNSNMTGLVTLIAWALFLTVIINYMANYSMRNNDARSAKAEILFTDLVA